MMSDNYSDRARLELAIHEACSKSAEGADLLITAFVQALRSYRRVSVCAPFPLFLIDDHKSKNFTLASEAVKCFPSTRKIQLSEVLEARDRPQVVESLHALSVSELMLLNWILHCRYHLHQVESIHEEFKGLSLPIFDVENGKNRSLIPSFVIKVQEVPAKWCNSAFESMKSQHGSIMAFHGTSTESLHSILRCGLLSMSRTFMQRNGAMFGDGVYLSTDVSVALTFSKAGDSWESSCFGPRVSYVLLCEVAKGEGVDCSTSPMADTTDSKRHVHTHGTYVVVQNCDMLKIRYVLIYSERTRTAGAHHGEVSRRVHEGTRGKISLFTVIISGYLCGLIILGYLKGPKSTRLSAILKQLWWLIDYLKNIIGFTV